MALFVCFAHAAAVLAAITRPSDVIPTMLALVVLALGSRT